MRCDAELSAETYLRFLRGVCAYSVQREELFCTAEVRVCFGLGAGFRAVWWEAVVCMVHVLHCRVWHMRCAPAPIEGFNVWVEARLLVLCLSSCLGSCQGPRACVLCSGVSSFGFLQPHFLIVADSPALLRVAHKSWRPFTTSSQHNVAALSVSDRQLCCCS